ncbi:MAG TPA: hypothetical protein VI544_01065 [Candidatus Nanoarchaeia archaeon]|nr:hypothetical protein [Candidatus Nanoarchaeia archaeon]
MAVDPKKLIAAINPDIYCKREKKKEVISIVKESLAKKENDTYLKAAEIAELAESDFMDFDEVVKTPFQLVGIKNPIEKHTLEYDTSSQAVEQVYFWLHDYLQSNKADYGTVEKLLDNFISAPGSAHFSEMGMKATKMQEEGMKILGIANQLIKSILNIIYDMKEFKLRLEIYNEFRNGKDKNKSGAAYLSLKQIWIDQVDIKKGNSSIKALAVGGTNAPNFVMLIDAFMYMRSLESLKGLDLNERLKRILEQRFTEFERWLKESERELRKRFEIEKIYLKSQLNTVKLYSKWAKPYLKAAAQLNQRAKATSALVTTFNTTLFEMVLLGVGEYGPEGDIARFELPKVFKGQNKRKYAPVAIVELKFRTIPERFQQGGYGFRGKAEITFTSFSLNEDERRILKEQLEWDDFKDVYKLVEGATEESLGQLQTDIDEILGESEKEEEKKSGSSEETNPFAALFSIVTDLFKKSEKPSEKSKKEDKTLEIKPDSNMEKVMRSQAGIQARMRCRKLYDSFKKANNAPAF